jgi:lysophospholipase L1-like esterase
VVRLRPDDPRLSWDGVVAWEPDAGWWQPWRLPPAWAATAMSPHLMDLARMPAGVRLGFRTDATELSLRLHGDESSAPVDVVIDGKLVHRLPVERGAQVVNAGLPGEPADVEVWLPQSGRTAVGDVELIGGELSGPMWTGLRWIVHGSSITHCRKAAGPTVTWPARVARRNGWRHTNLGFSGEAHLDHVVARTIRDLPADVISVCLGTNVFRGGSMASRALGSAVCGFLATIRDGHPRTPITVITPIAMPAQEKARNAVGLTLPALRDLVRAAVGVVRELHDAPLHVIDGPDLLRVDEDDLLRDGVHPTAEGNAVIAGRIAPLLRSAATRGRSVRREDAADR